MHTTKNVRKAYNTQDTAKTHTEIGANIILQIKCFVRTALKLTRSSTVKL